MRGRFRGACVLCALGVVALAPTHALSAPIFNRSAFDGVSHTLIDFETRGDGTPYDLPEDTGDTLDPGQYIDSGFVVIADGVVANVDDGDFENALSQVGSLQHSVFLMGGSGDEVGFKFARHDIHSVGISIVRNADFISGGPLVLRAYTQAGPGQPVTLLEEIAYDSRFIQGGVGVFDFGFIGITSDQPIVNFFFDFAQSDDLAIHYDDFIFSTEMVPAPGAAIVLLGAGCAALRRRREKR